MLTCTVCKETKPEDQFSRRSNRPKGHISHCKDCDKNKWGGRWKPKMQRGYKLKRAFGLSLEDYQQMLDRQGGVCAICKQPETTKSNTGGDKNLSVDHCHKTGKIRGLLCHHCNTGIGKFNDNVDLLEAAIKYIKEGL